MQKYAASIYNSSCEDILNIQMNNSAVYLFNSEYDVLNVYKTWAYCIVKQDSAVTFSMFVYLYPYLSHILYE